MAKKTTKKTKGNPDEVVQTIVVHPFNYTLELVIARCVHEAANKRNVPMTRNFAAAHCGADDQPFSYMFVPADVSISVIAHETFHCVWHIMEIIGAERENEVMAYTLSWLIDQIGPAVVAARKKLGDKKK